MTPTPQPTPLLVGSLFTGCGGLDMSVEAAFDHPCRTTFMCEIDPAASLVLAHRFPHVPNLGDIRTVDWAGLDPVDVLVGSSPCQSVSPAGRREGLTAGSHSNLWTSMADGIRVMRPPVVMWENVTGMLSATADTRLHDLDSCPHCRGAGGDAPLRAMGRIVADLADAGYDAVWCDLKASDVGACHQRARVWMVAWRRDAPLPVFLTATPTARHAPATGSRTPDMAQGDLGAASSPQNAPQALSGDMAGTRVATWDPRRDIWTRVDHACPAGHPLPWTSVWPKTGVCLSGDVAMLTSCPAPDGGARHLLRTPRSARGGSSTENIGKLTLPTPVARPGHGSPADHLRRKPGRSVVPDLAIIVDNGLLDTGGTLPGQASAARLPSPRASDGAKGGPNQVGRVKSDMTLPTAVARIDASWAAQCRCDAWGAYRDAVHAHAVAFQAPAPLPSAPTGRDGGLRLTAEAAAWMMGLPAGWITDDAIWSGHVTDAGKPWTRSAWRVAALRIAGNGVVPRQGEAAFRWLLQAARSLATTAVEATVVRREV